MVGEMKKAFLILGLVVGTAAAVWLNRSNVLRPAA
jgi:hypothetical protein